MFCDIGHLCAIEIIKRIVNVYLHCIVRSLEMLSKISTLPPLGNFLRTPLCISRGVKLSCKTNICSLCMDYYISVVKEFPCLSDHERCTGGSVALTEGPTKPGRPKGRGQTKISPVVYRACGAAATESCGVVWDSEDWLPRVTTPEYLCRRKEFAEVSEQILNSFL